MAKTFQKSDIKKAIKGSGGIISKIASRLKCDWHTAKKYINKHNLNRLLDNEIETTLDIAESKLIENIKEQDNTAIIFYLKTKGKHRGYVEKKEVDATVSINPFLDLMKSASSDNE